MQIPVIIVMTGIFYHPFGRTCIYDAMNPVGATFMVALPACPPDFFLG